MNFDDPLIDLDIKDLIDIVRVYSVLQEQDASDSSIKNGKRRSENSIKKEKTLHVSFPDSEP